MDNNLFTDLYRLREKETGRSAEAAVSRARRDVMMGALAHKAPERLRFLLLKITNRCNSDCEYCEHALSRAFCEKKKDLPMSCLLQAMEDAAGLGAEAVSISGGEPLIREETPVLIRRAVDCGITPILLTNGLLLAQRAGELGAAGLRYITISIDSVDPAIYHRQRGAELSRALEGLDAALALRRKYDDMEIYISTVLTEDNEESFLELLEYMNRKGVKVQISPYHRRRHDAEDYSPTEKERIEKLVNKLLEMKDQGALIGNSKGFLAHLPDFFCSGKVIPDGFRCAAGYTSMCIDVNGGMKPCWSWRFAPCGILGRDRVRDVWFGKAFQQYRDRMTAGDCEGCWYLCTSEVNMMLGLGTGQTAEDEEA